MHNNNKKKGMSYRIILENVQKRLNQQKKLSLDLENGLNATLDITEKELIR